MRKIRLFKMFFLLAGHLAIAGSLYSQDSQRDTLVMLTNQDAIGTSLEITFHKGLEHYYPLLAIWVEDMEGNYEHPLYVAHSMAKGTFRHARYEGGQ